MRAELMKVDRGAVLAVLLSAGPLAVLAHGILNAGSVFTGLLMVGSTAMLFLLGDWRRFTFGICDVAFVLLVLCIAMNVSVFGAGSDWKEFSLLIVSLMAYPAVRAIPSGLLTRDFIATTGTIVAVGAAATAAALVNQWYHPHGKPFVFGYFDAAATQFSFVLGLLVIALASFATTARRALAISAAIALPVAIFAASMVRFTLVATVVGLAISAFLAPRNERKFVAIVLSAFLVCVVAGTASRSSTTAILLRHAGVISTSIPTDAAGPFTKQPAELVQAPQWRCEGVDQYNSIEIRKHLYWESLGALWRAGLGGNGLDSFAKASCTGATVHNTFLQTAIDFGWVAGIALIGLVLIIGSLLWVPARHGREARFLLVSLVFVVAICLAHGRISRDGPLFLFLGGAAARLSMARRIKPADDLVPLRGFT
jgi:hypothetical protein